MNSKRIKDHPRQQGKFFAHEPIFGKNVIETLSEGMYDNSFFLFREYVQNAADAIDAAEKEGILKKRKGQIVITIDPTKRIISFKDNGTGIPHSEVCKKLANIGDSHKDRKKDKGFRGIGRLGGLGYCQKVRFETSVFGEDIRTILEWDAKTLHDILADKDEHIHAGELIKRITNISQVPCKSEEHYFLVSLLGVNNNCEELLDVEEVRKYLAMVAPVPFDREKFRFVDEIENFLKEKQLPIPCEYQLYLNGDEIRKGYETPLKIEGSKDIDILDVECNTIEVDDKVIGWYWYCVSRFDGVLSKRCWQRCFRLRKANIQIGEADCLSNHLRRETSLWKEDRGNNYFIGEIHALDEDLIPNSRRDYFNQDNACRLFETALAEAFKDLDALYHGASVIRSETKKMADANKARKDFEEKEKSGTFFDAKTREKDKARVEQLEVDAMKARQKIDKIYDKVHTGPLRKVADKYWPEVKTTFGKLPKKPFTPQEEPAKGFVEDNIPKDIMTVLKKVFNVLNTVLPPDQAQTVRDAIIRRFVRK